MHYLTVSLLPYKTHFPFRAQDAVLKIIAEFLKLLITFQYMSLNVKTCIDYGHLQTAIKDLTLSLLINKYLCDE